MATIPGVYVRTDVRTGPPTAAAPAGAALFVVGEATFGPIDTAVTVNSMSQFAANFGDRYGDGYLYDACKSFFEEGGQRAHVLRLWKGTAGGVVKSTKELATSNTDTSLYLTAKYLGTWANSLTVAYNGTLGRLTISGTPDSVDEVFAVPSNMTVAAIASLLNNTVSGSRWVTASVGLETGATTGLTTSATLTTTTAVSFAGATVPVALTHAEVNDAFGVDDTDADHKQYFGSALGAGIIAAPGFGPTTATYASNDGMAVWLTMIKHCVRYNRIACLTFGDDELSADTAITAKNNFVTALATEAGLPDETRGLEYAAIYHPWVVVPHSAGTTRTITPEGFVAAARARAHATSGAWRAGAGAISSSLFVLEPSLDFSNKELSDLAEASVNPIRSIAGTTRVYGARSLATDTVNWAFITYRDLLNYITIEAQNVLEPFVFAVVDSRGQLFAQIEGSLLGMLEEVRLNGGLYERVGVGGTVIDRGYTVNASSGLNTADTLSQGIVKAEIGVRVAPVGERIQIVVTKAALTSGL